MKGHFGYTEIHDVGDPGDFLSTGECDTGIRQSLSKFSHRWHHAADTTAVNEPVQLVIFDDVVDS